MSSLAVQLVRSLFCGLPRQEKRVALFIAASDETSGADQKGRFLYCGFLAPETEWHGNFAERWDTGVLEGPPRIPYLHMTDIRSEKWRTEHALTRSAGERRVGAAFDVLAAIPSLTPIGASLNAGHLEDAFTTKVRFRTGATRKFAPDYIAFIGYVYLVLRFCHIARPEAEKVDFIVERNREITKHIQEFYEDMPQALTGVGETHLLPLLGELTSAGKERTPLQAADLLCWYTRRYREGGLDDKNVRRYKKIATRKGAKMDLSEDELTKLAGILAAGEEA